MACLYLRKNMYFAVNIPFMKRSVFLFGAILLLFFSCTQQQPATDEDLAKFCLHVDSCLRTGNEALLDGAFDVEGLASIVLDTTDVSAFDRRDFKKGFGEKISSFWATITTSIKKGSSYKFMRLIKKGNETLGLFRFFGEDGLNYHEYHFTTANGKIQVADMYIYVSGELLSQTLKTVVLSALSETSGSIFGTQQFDASKGAFITEMVEMKRLGAQGKTDEALAIYNEMPQSVKDIKVIHIIYIMVCAKVEGGDSLYESAIDRYKALFPNDPALPLLLVDKYMYRKEYDKAIGCINELDKMVKDPYLDYLRGNLMFYKEKLDSSAYYFDKLNKKAPGEVYNSYSTLFYLLLRQKDYRQAAIVEKSIMKYFKKTGKEIEDEASSMLPEGLADYRSSEYYGS